MTQAQRTRFKARLRTKRQELMRDIHAQAAHLAIVEGEPDPIDRIQSMSQREEAVAMLGRLSRTLSSVENSLLAVSEGSYGVCAGCGGAIGLKRLETIPWASYCIPCQERVERRESGATARGESPRAA